MTSRQLKQIAVKQSILLRRQSETARAIEKNNGPITENQMYLVRMAKEHKRAEYKAQKSRRKLAISVIGEPIGRPHVMPV